MRTARSRLSTATGALFAVLCLAALGGCKQEAPTSAAVLIIESTPAAGAEVSIGSDYYGKTPVTIRGLPAGQYYAILEMYGYKRKSETLSLPAEGEVRLSIEMRPIVGLLTIESEPAGARVYLANGDLIGTTPLINAPVPTGLIEYELLADSFVPLRDTIEVKEDYKYSRRHLMVPLKGSLRVFSRPTGSRIYINDVAQDNLTPASFELAPGPYTIGAYHDGYLMGEQSIVVEPQGEHAVDLTLEEGFMPPGMVLVPAGEFIMGVDGGAPDEAPRRNVQVEDFYIDKFEVTNKEFAKVFPNHHYEERKADHPATGVTWSQAAAYAQAVDKRLPTEDEWEKAARGIDGREYPWGNTFDPELCNSLKPPPEVSDTTRVGRMRAGASPFGVLDMAGNAYEWTSTWYQPYPGNTDVKNEYGQVYRVLRGGSYLTDRFVVRAARRHYDKIDSRKEDYGFRCAMDATLGPKNGAAAAKKK